MTKMEKICLKFRDFNRGMLKIGVVICLLLCSFYAVSCSDFKSISTVCKVLSHQLDTSIAEDKAIICGYLIDRKSGEPIVYGYVTVPVIKKEIEIDSLGFFSCEVSKGKVLININSAGNTPYSKHLTIKGKEKITLIISLGTTWFACD
jgi:hypothetical protein